MFDNNGSFLLAMFEFFIFFAWIMCIFWVFGDIFRSRDLSGVAKTIWSIFIILIPFLGMLVYLVARGGGMTERSIEAQRQMQKAQDDYVRSVAGSNGSASHAAEQIASGKQLLDNGTITQAEFDQIKAKALA
ncbi:MAG: hypothetical protein QOK15_199 [Nocardioidaceae bacterium]|jgi:hypothetical protein|nr:hypothetical protein [Nocardioidaceae bacterium]